MAMKDGGPAFPVQSGYELVESQQAGCSPTTEAVEVWKAGMSLRDYFAAAAMASLLESREACAMLNGEPEYPLRDNVAVASYKVADAMLAAREATNGNS